MSRWLSETRHLEVSRFPPDSPARALAQAIAPFIEAARAADNAAHPGTGMNPLNALAGGIPARGDMTFWFEYLCKVEVLDAVAKSMGLPWLPPLLHRILDELVPPNWETFFWMLSYMESELKSEISEASARKRIAEVQKAFEERRIAFARTGGREKHEKRFGPAQDFVRREWEAHRLAYEGNRSAFARDYVGRVKHEFEIDVAHKTITNSWLKGL